MVRSQCACFKAFLLKVAVARFRRSLFIGNGPSLNKLDWSFLNAAKFPVVMGAQPLRFFRLADWLC